MSDRNITTDLRNHHDITCNYRTRPLFADGCICKVVNKHEHQREIDYSIIQGREIARLRQLLADSKDDCARLHSALMDAKYPETAQVDVGEKHGG